MSFAKRIKSHVVAATMAAGSLLPTAGAMAPGALMFAGAAPMMLPSAPKDVQIGGAMLTAISLILLDLQSGGKLGYTKKIVKAMRKIKGLEEANEATIIGVLTLGACTALGIGGAVEAAGEPNGMPGVIKAVAQLPYAVAAGFDFAATRKKMMRMLGIIKVDDAGVERTHENAEPIMRCLQQLCLFTGAGLVTSYGSRIDFEAARNAVLFTGTMFMLSNGVAISQLAMQKPFSGEMLTEMEKLAKDISALKPDEEPSEELLKRMRAAFEKFKAEGYITHPEGEPLSKLSPAQIAEAIIPVLQNINTTPSQRR